MQKWLALVFSAAVCAFVVLVVVERPPKSIAKAAPSVLADAGAVDAGPDDAGPVDAGARDGEASPPGASEENAGGPDALAPLDAGALLFNGTAAPGLGGDAPKSVVFGVILVTYKGAQGAPATARSHEAAAELSKQLGAEAKTDFKAALAKGDRGSTENAGRMPRGMLEPAPEYVLFSLPKDGVSEPVDTPRGFWIVHRIE